MHILNLNMLFNNFSFREVYIQVSIVVIQIFKYNKGTY